MAYSCLVGWWRMKIFKSGGKINFVDDNNVFVGYDYEQSCCELFGWSILDTLPTKLPEEGDPSVDYTGWNFDPTFYEFSEFDDLDEGGAVAFRLVRGAGEKFLILWNCHNGYYGHGFKMMVGPKTRYTDTL